MSFKLYVGGNSWSQDEGQIEKNGYNFTVMPAKFYSYFFTSSVANFNVSMKFTCSVRCKVEIAIGEIVHTVNTVGPAKN